MPEPTLRHAVRAIILSSDGHVLLHRHRIPGGAVWAAPGGGVEPGETRLDALRRELREEVGLSLDADPPQVWQQRVLGREFAPGYDGLVNDLFLVRTARFTPTGTLSEEELAAESVLERRWWSLAEIAGYRGPDLLSPRDLATPLAALLSDGVPAEPIRLGR